MRGGPHAQLEAERPQARLFAAAMAAAEIAIEPDGHETLRGYVSEMDRTSLYAQDHSTNVADHVVLIHREFGTSAPEIHRRYLAALLHDIGKTGVPPEILGKPGPLTPGEYEIVKQHAEMGAEVVSATEGLRDLVPEILHHHERIDGAGYPHGLTGEEIPFGARVLAVADVFDAMTSVRVYRRALSRREAVEELIASAGTQLDGTVVDAFIAALPS